MLPLFQPLIAEWFAHRYGAPSPAQQAAWPRVAAGDNVLLLAPTGAGKTLAAFLYALNQLVAGVWPPGRTSVLYVSPLKALNNDIQRNLLRPLAELHELFAARHVPFPRIRVATRSGDTPATDRRRLLAHPPEILITTPESLNLLLSTHAGQEALRDVRTLVLDEIHAVIDTKRGTHLITAVDRLVRHAGEFQRLALSATVTNPQRVAAFVGGYQLLATQPEPEYRPRPMVIVETPADDRYDLQVLPIPAKSATDEELVAQIAGIVAAHRSTLVFVNSRRRCESLAAALNAGRAEPLVYAHHGSLARELRLAVEARLKEGQLRGIVATSSLELGIDVGSIDAVVLLQCPPTVAAALQRVGRSGHAVNGRSLGLLAPTHGHDLLDLTVLARAVPARAIEPSVPVQAPLDVLAQILVSMTGTQTWDVDDLYAWVRTSDPYQGLSRAAFDLVLQMLAGRYGAARLRALRPRVLVDPIANTAIACRGAVRALFAEGGTIPDRGYYQLRELDSQARIGELDEEFVWENGVGSRFLFGSQRWQVERVTHNEVLVSRWRGAADVPFWKASQLDRGFHLAARIADFLEAADGWLRDGELVRRLQQEFCLSAVAAEQLSAYLARQQEVTRSPLPHRHHVLVEQIRSGPQGSPGHQVFIHAVWGRRVTRPWGLALAAAWRKLHGYEPEVFASNHGVGLVAREPVPAAQVAGLVTPESLLGLLHASLEGSAFFGAVFRECAGRALLIGRQQRGQRMPLWLSRIRSLELLEAVSRFDDFPILLEAWRACLRDHFDTEALVQQLDELQTGRLQVTECCTERGSPFAVTDSWYQVNEFMYRDDQPRQRGATVLRSSLLDEVVATPGLRPRLERALVGAFELKAQRLAPGYEPTSELELVEWVRERVLLPWPEWEALVGACQPGADPAAVLERLAARLAPLVRGSTRLVGAREQQAAIEAALYPAAPPFCRPLEATHAPCPTATTVWRAPPAELPEEATAAPPSPAPLPPAAWLAQWLRAYGPLEAAAVPRMLGLDVALWERCLAELLASGDAIRGALMADTDADLVCDAANFASLLRLGRAQRRLDEATRPAEHLQLLLATVQGLTHQAPVTEESPVPLLEDSLERLAGLPLPAEWWERDVLPARLPGYRPEWLDQALLLGELGWYGAGPRRVAFALEDQLSLLPRPETASAAADADTADGAGPPAAVPGAKAAAQAIDRLFEPGGARYDFAAVVRGAGLRPSVLLPALWQAVWRGQVSNDGFAAVRRGLQSDFRWTQDGLDAPEPAARRGSAWRHRRARARPTLPGYWYRRVLPEPWDDAVEAAEAAKEQVRMLLDRYGVLFRELLEREEPACRWGSVFRPLRLMELAGEVVAGRFFAGTAGPQFATPACVGVLARLDVDAVYWLSAVDPASTAGLGLAGQPLELPPRRPTTHLVFHGHALVLVSQRQGRSLQFLVPPEDPSLGRYLVVIEHLMRRRVDPVRLLPVERINEVPAADSPYVEALRQRFGARVEGRQVVLLREG